MIGMDHISQEDKRSSWAGTSRMKKLWYKRTNRTTNKKDIIQSDMRRLLNDNFSGDSYHFEINKGIKV